MCTYTKALILILSLHYVILCSPLIFFLGGINHEQNTVNNNNNDDADSCMQKIIIFYSCSPLSLPPCNLHMKFHRITKNAKPSSSLRALSEYKMFKCVYLIQEHNLTYPPFVQSCWVELQTTCNYCLSFRLKPLLFLMKICCVYMIPIYVLSFKLLSYTLTIEVNKVMSNL